MMEFYKSLREAIRRIGLRIALMLVGYVMLAIFAVSLTDRWLGMLMSVGAQLSQTRDNLTLLQHLQSSVLQAESAQRGYLLTMRESYLAPYSDAVRRTRLYVQQLSSQAASSSREHDKYNEVVKRITTNVEAKLTEIQIPIDLARTDKLNAAMEVLSSGRGLVKMNVLQADIQAAIASKNDELEQYTDSSQYLFTVGRATVAFSVLLVLLLIVSVIKRLFSEISNRDRVSKKLESEVANFEIKLNERTSQLKVLAVDYQYDVERERSKLARELHDELGSILTATKMDISWVLRKLKDTLPEASEKLTKTMRYLDQGIQFKRRIVQNLHPGLLTTFGLIPAIRSLVESAAERNNWTVDMVLPDESAVTSEALGLIAYRLVQETLTNASKYAEATQISVHMIIDDKYLKLEIEDNGKGMDLSTKKEGTHGLQGMRHRVIAIGGNLQIESEPGKGMFTSALIPLDSAPEERPGSRLTATPGGSTLSDLPYQ